MNVPAILDNIINLFKPKGDSVLGVDIGSSSIKIVQVRSRGGQAILETYGEVALGPYAGVDIGRAVKLQGAQTATALNDVIKEANATTRVCGAAIPITSSLITTMKIPRVDEANLGEVVSMEARRFIPVSMEEITLDWQIIPEHEVSNKGNIALSVEKGVDPGASPEIANAKEINTGAKNENQNSKLQSANVLIVAVHTETVDALKDVIATAQMKCKFIELEAFSTIRAVAGREGRTIAVIDLGASSTKVYVVDEGIIRVSHTIPLGSQDITLAIARGTGMPVAEAEMLKRAQGIPAKIGNVNLGKLMEGSVAFTVNESSKIIRDYQIKNNRVVDEIVLSGGGVNVKGFADLFRDRIAMKVRVADPFSNLVAPAFLENILRSIGPSFSVSIGTAIRALAE